jgi:D-alanyl-D-alanine carboxypeptidase
MTPDREMYAATTSRRRVLRAGLGGAFAAMVPAIPKPSAATRPSNGGRELDAALRGVVGEPDGTAHRPVGVTARILVAGRGAAGWRGAAGYSDLSRRVPAVAGVDYWCRVGSVTKAFTAVMVMQLVAERRLRLDDRVREHLPGVVPAGDRITIRQLLGMTSGLPDYVTVLFPRTAPGGISYRGFVRASSRPWSPRQLLRLVSDQDLRFEPGEYFHYSSTNYVLLGLILERITGQTYADRLRQRVIRPLRLHHTHLPEGSRAGRPCLCGYTHFGDRAEEWTDVTDRHEPGWAAGGLVAGMNDVARFFRGVLTSALLPSALVDEMQTPAGVPRFEPGGPDSRDYGLGLQRFVTDQGTWWGHGGQTAGYVTAAMSTPDGRAQIALCHTGFPGGAAAVPDPAAAFRNAARAAALDASER